MDGVSARRPVPFRAVVAVAEFRALWAAELSSVAGDQLARVALAVLVYTQTDSAALTALTYALTFVPAVLGGILLGGLGDRYPRREVLIAADVARSVLVAVMAVPGLPLAVLCVLVGAVTLVAGPFKAAHLALLADVLPEENQYTTGLAIRHITGQAAQLVGFAAGGALVAAINPSVGLLLDAGTFVISAVIVRLGVRHRPAAASKRPAGLTPFVVAALAETRLVWRDPGKRALLALVWLAAFYIAPEALAAPYADSIGAGALAVGLIMASDPAGSVIGTTVFARWVPTEVRPRLIGLLGVLAGLALVGCALQPSLTLSMILFGASGALASAYTLQATATYTFRLPAGQRAQGSGLLGPGLITVQGLGALAAGAVADVVGPAATVALAGAVGAVVAVPIALAWHRARDKPAGRGWY